MEPFVVKHYIADERPTVNGNGFDGLEICDDREEAERFVAFVNAAVAAERERWATMLAEVLQEAETWLDEARGCRPHDLIGYTGWAERARHMLESCRAFSSVNHNRDTK